MKQQQQEQPKFEVPRRIRWPQVAEIIGGGLSNAKRLSVNYDDFPKPLRISTKLVTFSLDEVLAWTKRHEGDEVLIKSQRGEYEARVRARRLAAVDPKILTRNAQSSSEEGGAAMNATLNEKRVTAHFRRTARLSKAYAKAEGAPPSTMAAIDATSERRLRQWLREMRKAATRKEAR